MSRPDTRLIEELLQEQNLDSDDVFCSEGGCFQVIDIRDGKIEKQTFSPFMLEIHVNNQGPLGNAQHLEIDNESSFQDLLASKKTRGTRIMCVYSYLSVGIAR